MADELSANESDHLTDTDHHDRSPGREEAEPLTESGSQVDGAPDRPDTAGDMAPPVDPAEAGPIAGAEGASAEAGATHSGFVAIVGKPNVGKSTLLNTMLGVKVAPITPKPQTTRRGVRGIYTLDDRQLVFVDTPGFHRARAATALDEYMRREVRNAVADVDAVLWVVDLRRPPNDEDKDVARLLRGLPDGTPVWLVGNKVDAAKYPDEALELYADLREPERSYSLSALNDPQAVYDLRDDLLELLRPAPFFFPSDIRSDQSREAWAGELIRESAMIHLREELPYSVAVLVTDWEDPEEPDEPVVISAEIWVDRLNHRPIVLGRGGQMIREIGRTARRQLELFLDQRVYLDLEVVVHRGWREDREALRELGYES